MAKPRGLPPSFDLSVPESVRGRPVDLGDYLDEDADPPPRPRPERREPPARPDPRPAPTIAAVGPLPPPVQPPHIPAIDLGDARRVRNPPRKQVNMTAETLRMVEELVDHVQAYSGQKDAKASELFEALVSALYEARGLIILDAVRPRGRWGTPTARAFTAALKTAFQAAIAEWQRRQTFRGEGTGPGGRPSGAGGEVHFDPRE